MFNHRDSDDNADRANRKSAKDDLVRRFLWLGSIRWITSVALAIVYWIVIRVHQFRTLTSNQKSVFDAVIVALSLALGLNIATALRDVALHMRLWFLDKKQVHIREVEVHSFMSLLALLWRAPGLALKAVCAWWLITNLVCCPNTTWSEYLMLTAAPRLSKSESRLWG